MQPLEPSAQATAPDVRIGHVHLRVSNLDRAIAFYSEVLGFDVMQRYDSGAAFLSAGGYHHHLGLNVWQSRDGTPPPRGHTGLYHVAFLYPDRAALAEAVRRVRANGCRIEGAADHGVSEAVYLSDPDGNGIELYRDRPIEEWPVNDEGLLEMVNDPLDLDDLLAAAPPERA